MIYQSFRLDNQVFLCMKITHSVILVGLYYGFMTTFSLGPSYLFFFGFSPPVEENRTEHVSAITGFLTGQFIMLISIFSSPLHLALTRPYTVTVLAIPYLFFHLFLNNHKHCFDFGYTSTINSMRNLSMQCIFLNNIIFQFLNLFLLPSSMSSRIVHIVMFRCHNKILFVISSFIGWLIGIIFFMKWVKVGYVYICQQKNSNRLKRCIRYIKNIVSSTSINNLYISILLNTFPENITKFIGSKTYYHSRLVKNIVSEFIKNYMSRILSILLFITCIYYLVRIPSPILTKKRKESTEMQENKIEGRKQNSDMKESREIFTVDMVRYLVPGEANNELSKATCYDKKSVSKIHYLDDNTNLILQTKKKEDKTFVWLKRFEHTLVTFLFDYQQWNRPLRYIKNYQLENDVRNEMSNFFFYTCSSDGKTTISFTYLSSLFTLLEMIKRKKLLFKNDLYNKNNNWRSTNEQKKNNQSNQFLKRMDALDKKNGLKKILEKRTRFCNKDKEYLQKQYDPFVNGSFRGTTKNYSSFSIDSFIENAINRVWINKIHGILFTDYRQIEQNKNETFDQKKSLLMKSKVYLLTCISQFDKKNEYTLNLCKGVFFFTKKEKMDYEYRTKDVTIFLIKKIITLNNLKFIRQKSIGVQTICKKVPKWSYKLIDELEQQLGENEQVAEDHYDIRSRRAKRIVIFTDYQKNYSSYYNMNNINESDNPDHVDEVTLIRYSQQSDFRRDLIKGTMRAQRRKTVMGELFQVNTSSSLFWDRRNKIFFFNFEKLKKLKIFIFRNKMSIISKLKKKTNNTTEERKKVETIEKKLEDKIRIEEIAETWDTILFAQGIRGCMLIIQSILRKYFFLPLLIIVKNCSHMLLFQSPEWLEDLKKWNREMHVKCTYNGVQLSEKEFPKNWLTDGLQIKILFPFCLKPWRSRLRSSHHIDPIKKKEKDTFCYLTVWGMEADLPFGSPRKRPSFFKPLFKRLEKKIIKWIEKTFFRVLRVVRDKKYFLRISTKKEWIIKNIFEKIIKNLLKKENVLELKQDVSSDKRDSKIINRMNHESFIPIFSDSSIKNSMLEQKMKDLRIDKKNQINNKMIIKENKKKIVLQNKSNIQKSSKNKSTIKKILESPKIFFFNIKKKTRLIRMKYDFIKNKMNKSAIDIIFVCCIINTRTINDVQFFLESTRKLIENICNESNQYIDKKNQTTRIILMIYTLKKSIYLNKNCMNSHILCNLSLSQTYLFYQFSKIQVTKLDKFRYILQNHGTSLFLKNEIKEFFRMERIHSDSKLRRTLGFMSEMKQWKFWLLRYHYQYDFSPIRWYRLSIKWRRKNRLVNQSIFFFHICDFFLYDMKVQFIHNEKKKTDYEELSLLQNKKENIIKNDLFDSISYNFFHYEYTNATIFKRLPLNVICQKNKESQKENYNIHKRQLFDMLGPFHNYLEDDGIKYIKKNLYRYIYCQINHFFLKKIYIDPLIDIDTGTNNGHLMITGTNNSGMDLIDNNKSILFITIHQQEKLFYKIWNWIGMNEQILINCPRSKNCSFIPKIFRFYNQYKIKPWLIPIQLLCLHFHENDSEKKNNRTTQKCFSLEKNRRNEEKGTRQGNRSDVQNQNSIFLSNQKKIEDFDTKSNMQKLRKRYRNHTETELDFFLQRLFFFQLRWDESLNLKMINNIKVYCFLIRLKNPKYMVLSSIQREEIRLDRMLKKDISLKELIKTGILIIEPVRLSVKKDRNFIMMYQTVAISLVHNSKKNPTQIYQEKKYNVNLNIKSIEKKKLFGKKEKKNEKEIDYLLISENIFSVRRYREFRVKMSFYLNKRDHFYNINIYNRKNLNFGHFLDENDNLDINHTTNKFKKLKLFFFSNYRLEDLTCMNRYWFNTNNSSRFSMLRICK
uniref:Protein TIC 214 n=1 Tax=Phoradendron leucarpum TaxID=3970 RepID=D3WCQ2_PHOLC|nr:putative RF1 protein [Phoradendron leucarpum]